MNIRLDAPQQEVDRLLRSLGMVMWVILGSAVYGLASVLVSWMMVGIVRLLGIIFIVLLAASVMERRRLRRVARSPRAAPAKRP